MTAFEQSLEELRAFVAEHAEIRMSATSLSVPREVRGDFYARVGRVQRELAEEILGGTASTSACVGASDTCSLSALVEVSGKCAQVREGLCAQAGLAQFKLASMHESLMADPAAEAVRPLFACVLDALQAGQDAGALRARAQGVLVPHVEMLYRNAYEAWAYYGVVSCREPRAFHAVFTADMKSVHAVPTTRVEVASQATSPTLRLPEAVFETAEGRVFAMKSEAAHELDFYGFKNRRRRDNSSGGNTTNLLTHRVLLLWELTSVDAVNFVADRDQSCLVPPALTVEVLMPREMAVPAYVSTFVERINAVRSRRPVQVIALDAVSGSGEPQPAEFPEGMLDDPTVAPIEVRHVSSARRFAPELLDGIAAALRA